VVLRIFVVDYVFVSQMDMTSPIHHCSSSDPSGSVEVAEGGEKRAASAAIELSGDGGVVATSHGSGGGGGSGIEVYLGIFSGRAGSGQEKARHRKLRPRPGPAQLSGLKYLPRPGPSEVFFVGPSGFRAGPSQKLPKILPRPGPSQQSGRVSAA
jgi:hypothetical protein